MPQIAKKTDPAASPESNSQAAIEKWAADVHLKFFQPKDVIVIACPNEFLLAEHDQQLMLISIPRHDGIIRVSLRMSFEEFMHRMPEDLMQELVRGVAVCEDRVSEIHPEINELEFDKMYPVKLMHHVSPDTLKKIGELKKKKDTPSPEGAS